MRASLRQRLGSQDEWDALIRLYETTKRAFNPHALRHASGKVHIARPAAHVPDAGLYQRALLAAGVIRRARDVSITDMALGVLAPVLDCENDVDEAKRKGKRTRTPRKNDRKRVSVGGAVAAPPSKKGSSGESQTGKSGDDGDNGKQK